MPLMIGARLGVYEITGPLGKGGMGEVYRARDTRLGRDVAVKILPELFAADDERLARFEREAKTLASLNHPNIAQIHGAEEFVSTASSPGARSGVNLALVMELVEGEDLSAIVERGPLPVRDALAVARQIADALATAHDRGVIHRDLKPSNVKVRDDGTVKVLDFGLAKLAADDPSGSRGAGLMNSPTITSPATQLGVILGTAAYMAPEQAKGRPVDRRADAWAFGAVLYEMLTGRRAFEGEDISETLAFVLTRDPDWTALPPDAPEAIRRLLRRCLERDRSKRLDSLAAARLEIEDTLGSPVPTASAAPAARSIRIAPLLGAAAAAAAIGAGGMWLGMRPAAVERPVLHLLATPLPPARLHIDPQTGDFDVSPDGRHIAYLATQGDSPSPELYIRRVDEAQPTRVADTLDAQHPFFSRDGDWIGFVQNNDLKKVPVHGGSAQTICSQCGRGFRGAAFMEDGSLLLSSVGGRTGIRRIPSAGGAAGIVTQVDNDAGERAHRFPYPLPGSQAVLFLLNAAAEGSEWVITAQSLKDGTRKRLVRGVQPRYVPSGHLLYVSQGTLFAVGFDPIRLEMRGTPVPVVNGVLTKSEGVADYALGLDGSLLYAGGSVVDLEFAVTLGGRQRGERARAVPRGSYVLLRFSPDGRRVILDSRSGDADFWVWDLREGKVDRFTFGPYLESYPVWAPDSSHVYFKSTGGQRPEGLYRQNADQPGGMPTLAAKMSPEILPTSIAPEGTLLVGHVPADAAQLEAGVYVIPLKGDSTPKRIAGLAPGAMNADISPDGKWIAYQAAESPGAIPQVYVQPFPEVTAVRRQISPAGGTHPLWVRRTNELFFRDMQARLISVPVRLTPTFSTGDPAVVRVHPFVPGPGRAYDVSPDGQTIVMIDEVRSEGAAGAPPPQLHMLLNWVEDLKRRVPGGSGARPD